MSKIKDLKGEKFGFLEVVELSGERKHGRAVWICRCECGNVTKVTSPNLQNGSTISCGCYSKEILKKSRLKHGLYNTRLYNIYICMKERCYNQKATSYCNYGGRGISVCEEWLSDFMNFYNWAMLNGYSDDLTIDRIDSDGNYEPDNCRWATRKTQNNNTRKNRKIFYKDKLRTVSEISEMMGIKRSTLVSKLNKGITIEAILKESEE